VIVGEVARVRQRIAWFEKAPLRRRRVMVARARPGASRIATRLRALGAVVLERPEVSIEKIDDLVPLEHALRETDRYDALLFGCSASVETAAKLLRWLDADSALKAEIPIIAVGREAVDALARYGLSPIVWFNGACGEAIATNASALAGKRLLLVASTEGRPVLKAGLEAAGASVESVPAYRRRCHYSIGLEELPELIVLPSSAAARLLLEGEDGRLLGALPMVAIGPITEGTARVLGATNVKRCRTDNIDSVIATVIATIGALRPAIENANA
jgi:uroporphyrinogen III methyltransferase / synthase